MPYPHNQTKGNDNVIIAAPLVQTWVRQQSVHEPHLNQANQHITQ